MTRCACLENNSGDFSTLDEYIWGENKMHLVSGKCKLNELVIFSTFLHFKKLKSVCFLYSFFYVYAIGSYNFDACYFFLRERVSGTVVTPVI